ncbi:MAG: DEAD/DEAH box helicase [Pelolinea sp.]|jgi:SNF2 family DNA or RNA helicase|nr:DEAD/DEAH box helicase [Pelolinea sp.]
MFNNFLQIFKRIEVKPIELSFEMDINSKGQHIVHIYRNGESEKQSKENIEKLMAYDYSETIQENNHPSIYTLKNEDRQTILSLKSLNPEVKPDGSLVFDIEPPVLNYLRKKEISETKRAKTVKVLEKSIDPTAQISYDKKTGIKINVGYKLDGKEEITPINELDLTKDRKYTRIKNTFIPIKKVSQYAEEILKKGELSYSIKEIPEFFIRDLVLIKKDFNAVLTDLAKNIQIITEPATPVISIAKDPQGWLDFDVHYNHKNFSLPRDLVLKAKENGDNYLQVDDLTWVKIDENTINKTEKRLEELEASLTNDGFRLPASEFASLEEFIDAIGGKRILDEAYQEFINQLSGFQADDSFKLPEKMEDHLILSGLNLRPYQREGIQWLTWLRKNQLHGILADDMGLGKTMQALTALCLGYSETESCDHSLIIAPKSVLLHWEREIPRVFNFIRVYIYHGPNRNARFFKSSLPYIFITTYETVLRDKEILAKIPFYYLILDEATRIKNPDTSRSQAIKALNAKHRLALTGTPVENRPAELWSLFDFLMKGHLGKYGTFVRVFENGIVAGNQSTSQQLGRRIKPFLLRRKKEEVAKDLPPKIEITEWVNLTQEQKDLYGSLQDSMKQLRSSLLRGENINYTKNILPVLTKLKQICDHPALVTGEIDPIEGRSEKFDSIIEKIEEIVDNNEQVIVFSYFLNMLSLFEKKAMEKKIPYIRIDGSTNNRQELIDQFNHGNAKVAFLSLMAAGHGINLTAANHVIHADRWWNPAIEDQATDRVHRIGQKKNVFVYQILTTGTLEEKIDRLLVKKKGMANQIIGAAIEGEQHWTREYLLELLKPLD